MLKCTVRSAADTEFQNNYAKYRGKCKEVSEALCKEDPTLTLVRGHYFCPIWNRDEQHWWCVKQDGTIVDPTKLQFPSKGLGIYTPFNGICTCDNCGKEVPEAQASFEGRFAFCSSRCYGFFVGII